MPALALAVVGRSVGKDRTATSVAAGSGEVGPGEAAWLESGSRAVGAMTTAIFDGVVAAAGSSRLPPPNIPTKREKNPLRGASATPSSAIVVTAFSDQSDASYYGSLGAFDLVTKPFAPERIVDVVNRAVGETETLPLVLDSLSLLEARDQVYRKLIVTALRRANWNQIKAAELLGVSRYCLIRWLRKLQINY